MNEDHVDPESDGTADGIADELFVHGLLAAERDSAAARHARVAAVMDSVRNTTTRPQRPRLPWLLLAVAGAIAVAVWLYLRVPDAAAVVESAVRAAATAGDRRFTIHGSWSVADTNFGLEGELDVRDARRYLVRAEVHGAAIVTGADDGPPWFTGEEHLAAHLQSMPQEGRAAFLLDQYGMTLGSPDAFLARMPDAYRFESVREGVLPEHPDVVLHVVAAQRAANDGVPDRVTAWIDPHSHAVMRLEFVWHGDPFRPPAPTAPHASAEGRAGHFVVLDLVGSASLPDDWFQAARHR